MFMLQSSSVCACCIFEAYLKANIGIKVLVKSYAYSIFEAYLKDTQSTLELYACKSTTF